MPRDPRAWLTDILTAAISIIAFRNQLTHAYRAIDHATVWGILERRVPRLRHEVERLLNELAEPGSERDA